MNCRQSMFIALQHTQLDIVIPILSVCPSRCVITSKQMHISDFFHRPVGPSL